MSTVIGPASSINLIKTFSFTARDVISNLVDQKISSCLDFQWISQLRYYKNEQDVQIQMITTDYIYGYEYLGNSHRLVITPLTDRCYRFVSKTDYHSLNQFNLIVYIGPSWEL